MNGRQHDAHRVAWELHNKRPIPDGLQIMHRCDVTLCVNPKHLDVGTNQDNIDDKVTKGRERRDEFGRWQRTDR